jgi:hypothetical protein
MFIRVALLTSALILAGCSDNDRAAPSPTTGTTSQELCDLVTPTLLEDNFAATFEDGEPNGTDTSFDHIPGSAGCYVGGTTPGRSGNLIDVSVSVELNAPSDDPLGDYFNGYDRISGLGDTAGFGPRPSGIYDVLLVVTKLDGKDRYLEVLANPLLDATVEQARPVAEVVLRELDA